MKMGSVVTFVDAQDARSGQVATIINILRGMDGPRDYWLQFADGSLYKANLAHIA